MYEQLYLPLLLFSIFHLSHQRQLLVEFKVTYIECWRIYLIENDTVLYISIQLILALYLFMTHLAKIVVVLSPLKMK